MGGIHNEQIKYISKKNPKYYNKKEPIIIAEFIDRAFSPVKIKKKKIAS